MRVVFTIGLALTLILLASAGAAAGQQQDLQRVKELYSQASYEDALGVLSGVAGEESVTEVARYRAACLLALGRTDDARKAVGEVVRQHPDYLPDPGDTSPRVVDLFRTTRRAVLPEIARTMYTTAKGAMDRNELAAAIDGFDGLVRLIDSPDLATDQSLSDLRVLAVGFMELARGRVASAKADAPAAPPARLVRPTPPVVTPAVPVAQQLPPWNPPDSTRGEFVGAVHLRIGEDGRVAAVSLDKPIHPAYDALLLSAARRWVYQPARQDGVPIASERVVQVILKPKPR